MSIAKNTCKHTLITGASSGIGYEVAKAFANRGKNLIVVARRTEQLEQLKTEILSQHPNLDVVVRTTDLSFPEKAIQLYESLRSYNIETWINNAGFGGYQSVADQDFETTMTMLRLNVETLTLLSSLYVHDYSHVTGTQLINLSSAGGYVIVPTAVTYCATKFFVSTFTEGLARELQASKAKLQAKVLAPAATKTEFGKIANKVEEYDYNQLFGTYHTSKQVAGFLMALYDSDCTVGAVNRETFEFQLSEPIFPYASNGKYNQKR